MMTGTRKLLIQLSMSSALTSEWHSPPARVLSTTYPGFALGSGFSTILKG
jgi:hypothetical protein